MSFQPVIVGSGLVGWQFLQSTGDRQREVFDRSSALTRDTDYFEANIGKIGSAEALVDDRRLLRVALGAFGLQDDIDNRFFIEKILAEGVSSPDALANKLTDERYKELARAFGFDSQFGPRTTRTGFGAEIVAKFRVQEFEVARQGYHQRVIGYFWQNESGNSELDWLSYGLPLMLAYDLNRVSPVISVETPFASAAIQHELRSNGYPDFVDEPQGLRLEIARDRRSKAFIVGSFSEMNGTAMVDATLMDVESGRVIADYSVTGSDWLTAVDDITAAVLESLEVEPSDSQSDDPVGQHFSNSLEAIEHFTNGEVAIEVHNDFPNGIAQLQNALAIDPEFAEAEAVLSIAHYLASDLESARVTASQALRNDYRLSETSKFILKANRYIFDGDFDRGVRVVEIWTRVQPNSIDALATLAQVNTLRGTSESLETASGAYDRLLELDPQDYGVYRRKAELEQQRGDFAAAAAYLQTFLEYEPDSSGAHLQLANVYQGLGDLEAAQVSMEDAAILSDNPLESELGLARLLARRGLFDEAEARLAEQLSDDLSPQQELQVLSAQAEVAFVTGQIEEVIALNLAITELS